MQISQIFLQKRPHPSQIQNYHSRPRFYLFYGMSGSTTLISTESLLSYILICLVKKNPKTLAIFFSGIIVRSDLSHKSKSVILDPVLSILGSTDFNRMTFKVRTHTYSCYPAISFSSRIILDSDLADGHVGDGLLDGLPLALLLVGVQLRLQLEYLPLLCRREVLRVRHFFALSGKNKLVNRLSIILDDIKARESNN
jgi:hypothetical protein